LPAKPPAVDKTVKCTAEADGLARLGTAVWAAPTVASTNAAKTIVILRNPFPLLVQFYTR